MGNHLNRTAQIVSPPLLGDDRMVYFPGGKVVVTAQSGVGKSFIVPKIQIGFCAVIRYIDLSMLERVHGSRIHIDVRIEFLQGYGKPAAFKQCSDSRGSKSFAQR